MRTRIASSIIFTVIAIGVLGAQNKTSIKEIPLSQTSPASGKEMFATYCAVCHGTDGKGGGPAAAALKKQPVNLTQLTSRNNGKYPDLKVMEILSAKDVIAHGSQEMPVWGNLFKSLGRGDVDLVQMRIVNVTSYIKSIQQQ